MATNIPDDELLQYADRAQGQTIIITGAARGIGREAAILFGRYGAKVVIGDIDVKAAEETVSDIKKAGGVAICQACNVLDYDQQVSLFELAIEKFGRVDAVIPNAGVTEISRLTSANLSPQGLPTKPNLKTVEIDFISVLYTTQLASYYFTKNKNNGSLKSLVLIGSMASFSGIPRGSLYSSSKHALLGLTRSLKDQFEVQGFRVAIVCPFFADTDIVPTAAKVLLAGIPLVPIPKIAAAYVLAATDAPDTNGSAYTLPDEREVFRIPHVHLDEGVYKMLTERVKRLQRFGQSIITFVVLAKLAFRSPITKLLLGIAVGYGAYQIAAFRGLS